MVAMNLLLTTIVAIAVAPAVDAHGWLEVPAARQMCDANRELRPDIYLGGGSSTGDKAVPSGGVPDFCGDPFMDKTTHKNGEDHWTKYKEWPCESQATYQEGGIIETTMVIPANHGGFFMVSVCDSMDMTEECFAQNQLLTVEHGVDKWWIMTGEETDEPDVYTMEWMLPAGLSCERCMLMWTYYTGHLCSWPCDREVCGFYADGINLIVRPDQTPDEPTRECENLTPAFGERPQMFRNCADVTIEPGPGGATSAPAPAVEATTEDLTAEAPTTEDETAEAPITEDETAEAPAPEDETAAEPLAPPPEEKQSILGGWMYANYGK